MSDDVITIHLGKPLYFMAHEGSWLQFVADDGEKITCEVLAAEPGETKLKCPPGAGKAIAKYINEQLAKQGLREWVYGEFKQALKDEERLKLALAMIKVGLDKKDDPLDTIRNVIGAFVFDLVDPEGFDRLKKDHEWRMN